MYTGGTLLIIPLTVGEGCVVVREGPLVTAINC